MKTAVFADPHSKFAMFFDAHNPGPGMQKGLAWGQALVGVCAWPGAHWAGGGPGLGGWAYMPE